MKDFKTTSFTRDKIYLKYNILRCENCGKIVIIGDKKTVHPISEIREILERDTKICKNSKLRYLTRDNDVDFIYKDSLL